MRTNKSFLVLACCAAMSANSAPEFEFSGLLEAETLYSKNRVHGISDSSTDTYLATAELAFGAQWNEQVRTDLVLLAEDVDNVDPDDYRPTPGATEDRPDRLHVEAFTLTWSNEALSVTAGRKALPFGNFETAVLTDPQTLELGETTTEFALEVANTPGAIAWTVAGFSGNLRNTTPETDGLAANVDIELQPGWVMGAGYISAQGAEHGAPALVQLRVAGQHESWLLLSEYVGAASEHQGERPQTLSLDIGYALTDQWQIGGRWQATDEFSVLDQGNGRFREWSIAATFQPVDGLSLGLEVAKASEGPADERHVLFRLAAGF